MATTELTTPRRASGPPHPSFREEADETNPLVGAVPLYGPPVIALLGPWLLVSLMLAGPFALVVTLVVAVVAVSVLVGLIGATLAATYRLVRRLGRYRAPHAPLRAPVPPLVVGASR